MSITAFTRLLLLLLLALSLPSFGCDGDQRADAGAEAPELDADAEPSETEDATPLETDACSADACAPRAGSDAGTDQLDDGVVGSACNKDEACGDGRCLLSERVTGVPYPDGYCTGRCREDAHCGERGYCAPGFRGAIGSCLLRCESDADCGRAGYRCRVTGAIGRCMPGPAPLPEGVVGNACNGDAQCGGAAMSCVAELAGVAAPGGYCSVRCSVDADCSSGGACVSGLGTAPVPIGTCYARCEPPGGCREGYSCNALSVVDDDRRGLCVPNR